MVKCKKSYVRKEIKHVSTTGMMDNIMGEEKDKTCFNNMDNIMGEERDKTCFNNWYDGQYHG